MTIVNSNKDELHTKCMLPFNLLNKLYESKINI